MTWRRRCAALGLALAAPLVLAQPASADVNARIARLQQVDGQLRVLLQVDDLAAGSSVDVTEARVFLDGRELDGVDRREAAGSSGVRQTAVLAIDRSRSMSGDKLDAAKSAALAFLDAIPESVRIGLVTFGSTAEVAAPPSMDRQPVRAAVESLVVDTVQETALFDATAIAAEQSAGGGARSVIVITDGDDTGVNNRDPVTVAADAVAGQVTLDAVYIGEEETPAEFLTLVNDAEGELVTAQADDLASIIDRYVQAIEDRVLLVAPLPKTVTTGTVTVVGVASGQSFQVSRVLLSPGASGPDQTDYGPRRVEAAPPSPWQSPTALSVALGALFFALLLGFVAAFSALSREGREASMRRRLSLYTLTGRQAREEPTSTVLGASQVARTAVELAGKVVRRRDFESDLALRLEAAGVPLRAAEWMLLHIGSAVSASLLMLLISGGQIVAAMLGLLAGLGLPFAYLIIRESRRTSAFLAQLPDTLQLLAGSLTAGYSMAQAMDTVVREGSQPIVGEFNRALVEARLGVPIEDAMDGVAERMKSRDFAWVVMAIRIQREVGGNLAELLTTVSSTLRERERLRRQVKVLSAEGRLSAWILGLLPPVFASYLLLVQPEYLRPLVNHPLGWALLFTGVLLLVFGVLWMRRAVRVEV